MILAWAANTEISKVGPFPNERTVIFAHLVRCRAEGKTKTLKFFQDQDQAYVQ